MRRVGGILFVVSSLLVQGGGCGTMANVAGQEVWLMGPPPQRPVEPFGGVDNDLRWMKRGISPERWEPLPIVAATIDMPFSFVGDIVTLPWIAYQSSKVAGQPQDQGVPPQATNHSPPN